MRRLVVLLSMLSVATATVRADAITVRRLDGRCGDNILDEPAHHTPLVLRARLQREGVRLFVRNLTFNCGAPPEFHTNVSGGQVLTLEPYLPTGHPVASCTCLHDLTLLLEHVPAGHWTIRIQTGTHVVQSPSGLVSAPDFASTTVDVR